MGKYEQAIEAIAIKLVEYEFHIDHNIAVNEWNNAGIIWEQYREGYLKQAMEILEVRWLNEQLMLGVIAEEQPDYEDVENIGGYMAAYRKLETVQLKNLFNWRKLVVKGE